MRHLVKSGVFGGHVLVMDVGVGSALALLFAFLWLYNGGLWTSIKRR